MGKPTTRFRCRFLVGASAAAMVIVPAADSAVTLDGTMGPSGALTGPAYVIAEIVGQTRGTNLFHSFGQFSLTSQESATFTGSVAIQNIIGRVTGGEISSIDSLLRSSIPGANLYLINPSGVVFGQNARLDVSGSFYASTADYLTLADGGRLDARTPSNDVLTTAPPAAFGFLGNHIAPISVMHSRLYLLPGKTLALIGGDISLSGENAAQDYVEVIAPSGQVQLVSLASAGEVDVSGGHPDVSGFPQLGNIRITDGFQILTQGDPGGTVLIRGGQLAIDGGLLNSVTTGATDHPGIGIDIAVTGDVVLRSPDPTVNGTSEMDSSSSSGGAAGSIVIQAGRLVLQGNERLVSGSSVARYASIGSRARGVGDGGNVTINVDELQIGMNSRVTTESSGTGNAGDIAIDAGHITLDGTTGAGTQVTSVARATGNAGNLEITANDIAIRGGANGLVGFFSDVQSPPTSATSANAGDINVTAESLRILDGAQIRSGVFIGSGHGGNISVVADQIYISGLDSRGIATAGISSMSIGSATGDAGDITVTANNLTVDGVGLISSSAYSYGGAGDIAVNADSVRIIGGGHPNRLASVSAVSGQDANHGGNITVSANSLEVLDGGTINTQTIGPGNGGNVTLDVGRLVVAGRNELNSIPSEIRSTTGASGNGGDVFITANTVEVSASAGITTNSYSVGNGGDTTITADTITVRDNGIITATSRSTGVAGDIYLNARDSLILQHAEITTSAVRSDGGNITIRANRMLYMNSGLITTSVRGGVGDGGNIDIDPEFVVLNHSRISADAFGGNGGNVTIVADHFLASADSAVTASSTLGLPGNIVIRAPTQDLSGEIENLPETALDADSLFRSNCTATGGRFSSFTAPRMTAAAGHGLFLSSYATIEPVEHAATTTSGTPSQIGLTSAGSWLTPSPTSGGCRL